MLAGQQVICIAAAVGILTGRAERHAVADRQVDDALAAEGAEAAGRRLDTALECFGRTVRIEADRAGGRISSVASSLRTAQNPEPAGLPKSARPGAPAADRHFLHGNRARSFGGGRTRLRPHTAN